MPPEVKKEPIEDTGTRINKVTGRLEIQGSSSGQWYVVDEKTGTPQLITTRDGKPIEPCYNIGG